MRILLLADIHIGSIKDTEYVYRIITDIIDKEVVFTHTDVVVVLGDYFDKLFKVNEETVSLAINIMSYLVRACIREKTSIRLIYGTESHEMNQYKLFNYHITSSNVDMKVIDTVCDENINGHHILYIPEEYVKDKISHYAKFLNSNNHYDYIFGHGIIEDGMPGNVSISHERNKTGEKQVPRFKSGELSAVCDICVFGHYHVHTKVNKSVYYLGSLFRNSFGEEVPKYYGIIEDHKISFIENTDAYVYKTYSFNPDSSIYNSSDDILKELEKIKSNNSRIFEESNGGKIRLVLNLPADLDPSLRDNIRNIISKESCIVTQFKESNDDLIEEVKEDIDDELDFILDPSLIFVDKIFRKMCMDHAEPPMTEQELMGYLRKTSVASLIEKSKYPND